jgi:ABC-type hemin transport system substrate-binding protein
MPRMTININQPNVEQIEYTVDEIKDWVANPMQHGHEIQERLQTSLDEAQADVDNGSTEVQYILIKITK